jgi:GNAT superfamily N-acetyltransferase
VWLTEAHRAAAVELLVPTYWNQGIARERIATAVNHSTANVGATDATGALIAHARALSDWSKYAWIYDVVVAESWRGRGLGHAVMRLLLDHPAVRGASQVLLATRDAQPLYAKFGFIDRAAAPPTRAWRSTEMVLRR